VTEPYKNLGYALKANPDLWERFHVERRGAFDTWIRTLDPADKERADAIHAEILSELENRGISWLERGVAIGFGASPVRDATGSTVHDGDIAHRLAGKRAREAATGKEVRSTG
jgi:hypothetical protein